MALRVTIYLETLGKVGLRTLAEQNHFKAVYLAKKLGAIQGFRVLNQRFFNEFTLETPPQASTWLDALRKQGIRGGLDLSQRAFGKENCLLVAVTEKHTKSDLDGFVKALKDAL
jgi:glycine dehydrogenase subunit 1